MTDIFNPCPLGCNGSGWIWPQDTPSTGDLLKHKDRRSCALHSHPGLNVPYKDFCVVVDFMKKKLAERDK